MSTFDEIWERLEAEGKCDCLGGMAYERIKRLAKRLKTDEEVEALIVHESNCGPDEHQI